MAGPSNHADLVPGSVLGRYRIERMLGHGGMATVYLAVQEDTGLQVALKVLVFRGESARPGGDVARFIREARLAGGIRHPHWVSVYETGYDTHLNLYYIAMERMHASLAQRLRAHGPMTEAEAIGVVEQMALALEKAGEMQMVHRDIKPGNILYNAEGVCKLTDFGIAKSSRNEETQLTLREAVFGTPAYMSPEQATDARKVDARSDIYSLGTVFFELLAGERPYQGETPVQVLAQVITDAPPPDVRNKPRARHVRADTAKLILSMMAKDPAARPQTPSELLARLRRLKSRVPYKPPAPSAGEEPPYDDSTVMEEPDPPPSSAWSDPGAETERAPAPMSTGVWPGAAVRTEGRIPPPRTETGVVTRATQVVGAERTGTVATRIDRTGAHHPVRAAPKTGKKGNAAAVWFLAACAVLVGLIGLFWAAEKHEWFFTGSGAGNDEGAPSVAEAETGELAEESDAGRECAFLRFGNENQVPIQVECAEPALGTFVVGRKTNVVKKAGPGVAFTIKYRPRWGDFEDPEDLQVTAPEAGKTNEVQLALWSKKAAFSVESASLDFHNPLPVPIRVTPGEGWGENPFDVLDGSNLVRTVQADATLAYEVSTPTSSDYENAAMQTTAGPAGTTNPVTLSLKRRTGGPQGVGTVTLSNTNDVDVFAEWQGNKGAKGSTRVLAGEKYPVSLDTDEEVTVTHYVNDTDYEEYSPENACTNKGLKAGKAPLDLKLTKRPDPVLTLRNSGKVGLKVTWKREGKEPQESTLETGASREVPCQKNERMSLTWAPVAGVDPKWQGGRKVVGPYELGAKPEEVITATEREKPQIAIYNDSKWLIEARVTDEHGYEIWRKRVEGYKDETIQVPREGEYRVTGVAIDTNGNRKAGYDPTEATVSCKWDETQEVSCVPMPSDETIQKTAALWTPEVKKAIVCGNLKRAERALNNLAPGAHGWEGYLQRCEGALQEAREIKLEDVDDEVNAIVPFADWKKVVAEKSQSFTDIENARWKRIRETTEASRNWKEFLEKY